jgi:hypothetical protein
MSHLTRTLSPYIHMCMIKGWTEAELRGALNDYETELRSAGKARNTIATYVQHPERFINWLVGRYQPRPRQSVNGRSSRYQPLRDYLSGRSDPVLRLTFSQIEEILGASLPASARKYRPWWANEAAGTHVHARAWLDSERRTANVDLNAATVEFVRLSGH